MILCTFRITSCVIANYLAHIHRIPVGTFLYRKTLIVQFVLELQEPRNGSCRQLELLVKRVT